MELAQIRLIVGNFPASFRFYRDVMGLKPQVDDERGPYGKFSFPTGASAIALHDRANLQETVHDLVSGHADRAVIAIKVDDVDAAVATLKARGAAFQAEPQIQWGRLKIAHLRDPEGNLIELQEWLAPR